MHSPTAWRRLDDLGSACRCVWSKSGDIEYSLRRTLPKRGKNACRRILYGPRPMPLEGGLGMLGRPSPELLRQSGLAGTADVAGLAEEADDGEDPRPAREFVEPLRRARGRNALGNGDDTIILVNWTISNAHGTNED